MSRLHGLDAMRGVAAALVVVAHLLGQFREDGHEWAASALATFDLGTFGVTLFFLISGFVIPFSLSHGLAAFGVSRAARLLPALWLSIGFCLALGEPLESSSQLFANAIMLAPVFGETRFSGPYWTLSWELYFYGIVALAFAFGWHRSPRIFGCLSILTVVVALFHPVVIYLAFLFNGALLRIVLLDKNEADKSWLYAALAALAGLLTLWALYVPKTGYVVALVLPVPAFMVLWKRLNHPVLLWLGSISYSLYLFNLPLIEAAARIGLSPLLLALASVSLALLLSALVYRWVEEPCIAHGKWLSRRLERRQKRPTQAPVSS